MKHSNIYHYCNNILGHNAFFALSPGIQEQGRVRKIPGVDIKSWGTAPVFISEHNTLCAHCRDGWFFVIYIVKSELNTAIPKKAFIKNTRLLATGWILWRNAAKKNEAQIYILSPQHPRKRHQNSTRGCITQQIQSTIKCTAHFVRMTKCRQFFTPRHVLYTAENRTQIQPQVVLCCEYNTIMRILNKIQLMVEFSLGFFYGFTNIVQTYSKNEAQPVVVLDAAFQVLMSWSIEL